jgi:hypothetical protein
MSCSARKGLTGREQNMCTPVNAAINPGIQEHRTMATASRNRNKSRSKREQRTRPGFMDDLLAMAGSLAGSRKDYAAEQLETLADSVREFAEAMPPIPTMRAYASTAADNLEELADYVVESEISDMLNDARNLMRRHPLATFGGSVAAGLVITQLIQMRGTVFRWDEFHNSGSDTQSSRRRPPARSRKGDDDANIVDADSAESDESAGPMF